MGPKCKIFVILSERGQPIGRHLGPQAILHPEVTQLRCWDRRQLQLVRCHPLPITPFLSRNALTHLDELNGFNLPGVSDMGTVAEVHKGSTPAQTKMRTQCMRINNDLKV